MSGNLAEMRSLAGFFRDAVKVGMARENVDHAGRSGISIAANPYCLAEFTKKREYLAIEGGI